MSQNALIGTGFLILHIAIIIALIVRVLLRPHREPTSRIAWIVLIIALPILGIVAYLLLGETNIGRRRVARMRQVISKLPNVSDVLEKEFTTSEIHIPKHYAHLFEVGKTVNGFAPVGGNHAQLMQDSNSAIASIVADIDAAQNHVHVIFYIWLADNNGCHLVNALKRAAKRGVTCRVMADGLGSRSIITSSHWKAMRQAGVHLAEALPIGRFLLGSLKGRVDLRNHRKIVVIDNIITYSGSQNCADPEFKIKAKYAPWVDIMMRFEGAITRQNQYLFACDWESETGEDIGYLLKQPLTLSSVNQANLNKTESSINTKKQSGFIAQVIGTGPTVRYSAMPEIFETLMYAARHQLVITTPYYVPDEPMQAALCASARRGVKTTVIFPARNDSWIVAAASHSYYAELLAAGVRIFEYQGGLLHTKSLTIDREVTLIGSANMDRRSFELNYENNILFYDASLTAKIYERQCSYLANSKQVNAEMVQGWTRRQKLLNNAIAMLGPVL